MLMVGFRGTSADTGDSIVRDIEAYGVGSVVLFDYDVLLGETGATSNLWIKSRDW